MKRVRLGIIGTGLAFRHLHWPALRELKDRFAIVGLCNRTATKAEAIAAEIDPSPIIYTDHRELLARDDLEAVLVAVPIHLTAGIVRDALSRDKHVLQEKPIAVTVAEAQRAIELAADRPVVLMVGENHRYRPRFRQVHRLVQQGVIGRPRLYRLNDLHYRRLRDQYSRTAWRRNGKHDGGYLLDGGIHVIAGMREMVRIRVTSVHGLRASFNPSLSGGQDDTLLLQLTFANGLVGQMALGYSAIDQDARRPKMYGDKGTLVLDPDRKLIELWRVGREAPTETFPMETIENDFKAEWLDFYSAIVEGKTPRCTPEEALADLRILDAGRRSAATGEIIRLV
jgi:predicted dehydrogenase